MRRTARRSARIGVAAGACALALAGATTVAGPAWAKGIQSATISGPGLDDPIDVAPSEGDGGELAALTAVWRVMPGQPQPPSLAEAPPPGELGPRYTVAWDLMTGPDETTTIRQDLYPYAPGGPLVHTTPGQPIFDDTTVGGWAEAPDRLRVLLQALGVPRAGALPAGQLPAATATEAAHSPERSPWPAVTLAVAGVAVLAVGGAFAIRVRRARRRGRVAPIPL